MVKIEYTKELLMQMFNDNMLSKKAIKLLVFKMTDIKKLKDRAKASLDPEFKALDQPSQSR